MTRARKDEYSPCYPEFSGPLWSFKHTWKLSRWKAGAPPLGLLTVTAMLPLDWENQLVDERAHYGRLFFWTLFRRPRLFPLAVTLAIYGFHFRQVIELHVG